MNREELPKAQQARMILQALARGDAQITHVLPSYKGEVTDTTAWTCDIKTTGDCSLTFRMEGPTISIVGALNKGDNALLSPPAPMDVFAWLTGEEQSAIESAVFKALDQVIPD